MVGFKRVGWFVEKDLVFMNLEVAEHQCKKSSLNSTITLQRPLPEVQSKLQAKCSAVAACTFRDLSF